MAVPVLVVAGLALVALGLLCVLRPRLSLALLVGLDITNITGVLAELTGVSIFPVLLLLAAASTAVVWWRGQLRWAWTRVHTGLLMVYAASAVTVVFSGDVGASLEALTALSRDLLVAALVYVLVLSTRSARLVLQVAVLGLAALAAVTVVHEYVLDNEGSLLGLSNVPLVAEDGALTPRHAGPLADVNFWARLQLLVVPLAFSLWAMARRRLAWLVWGGAVASLVVGVYLTQSRGAFLTLPVMLVLWLVLAGPRQRRLLPYLPLALVVLVPVSGVGARLATLVGLGEGQGPGVVDLSVLQRVRFQEVAWRMFVDSPLVGQGIGTYPSLFQQFDRASAATDVVAIAPAAHNFYLEQAADGGLLLLGAWAGFFGAVLVSSWRSRQRAQAAGLRDDTLLAAGLLTAIVGWLTVSVTLHLSNFRALLVIAVLVAAQDVTTRRFGTASAPSPRDRRPTPVPALAAGTVAAALTAGAVTAGLAAREPHYEIEMARAVVPHGIEAEWYEAYQLNLLERETIVPTFVTVLQAGGGTDLPGVDVEVSVSNLSSAIHFTVSGPDRDRVEAAAAEVTQAAARTIRSLSTPYFLVRSPAPAAEEVHPWRLPALALGAGALLAWTGAALGLRRFLRERRRADPGDPLDFVRSPVEEPSVNGSGRSR